MKSIWRIPEELTLFIKKDCRATIRGAMTSPKEADYIFAENLMLMGAELTLKWKSKKDRQKHPRKDMKIVINSDFGGFGLNHKALMKYAKLSGFKLYAYRRDDIGNYVPAEDPKKVLDVFIEYYKNPQNEDGTFDRSSYFDQYEIPRDDLNLIKVVEEMGKKANGDFADLEVVKVPKNVKWELVKHDGKEFVKTEVK